MATEIQNKVAKCLGVDVSDATGNVAAALIRDAIALAIHERPPEPASEGQLKFARSLGLDVSADTKRVASARISDVLDARNQEAIRRLGLKPGVAVVREKRITIGDDTHLLCETFIISSIRDNGLVYFRGGNGQCAWAGTLRLATKQEAAHAITGGGAITSSGSQGHD